ncbi:MAG: carbohydrate kinase family protein [Candidatus Bathyarchaeota archaeon]|jgi:ribokinase
MHVIGFGALNVDQLFKVNRIAASDEESYIIDSESTCGGSAANTIVGLARLGCQVGFIGKIADDEMGKMLLNDFSKEGVDTRGIIITNYGGTGKVLGFVDLEGDRALYVNPGVNDSIDCGEISKEFAFQTEFMHLSSFIGERSFRAQRKIVEGLPKTVKVSLDPGEIYARKAESLESLLRRTHVFMPNEKEIRLLTGINDIGKAAEDLIDKGVKIVAVKLGDRGCYITDGRSSHFEEAFMVTPVDTTGAGDAFCAGFLYGLIYGKSLRECGRIGNFVASRSIMMVGARDGLPRLEDLKLLD